MIPFNSNYQFNGNKQQGIKLIEEEKSIMQIYEHFRNWPSLELRRIVKKKITNTPPPPSILFFFDVIPKSAGATNNWENNGKIIPIYFIVKDPPLWRKFP